MKVSYYVSKKITFLSFVFAYLVVVIHSNNLISYFGIKESTNLASFIEIFIGEGIARIAVPFFFIISGFFFFVDIVPSVETFLKKYKSRVRSLLLPYLLWNLIGYIYSCIITRIAGKIITINSKPTEISFNSFVFSILTAEHTIFWFVGVLIVCVIVSPIIYYIVSKPILSEIYISILLVLWILFSGNVGFYVGILFFSLGAYIALRRTSLVNLKANRVLSWTSLILLIVVFLLNAYLYPSKVIKIGILIGIPTIWVFYDIFEKKIKVSNFMKYSFFIYATHIFIVKIIVKLILIIFGKGQLQALLNFFLTPMFCCVILIVIGDLLEKYTPKLWEILNGGRN